MPIGRVGEGFEGPKSPIGTCVIECIEIRFEIRTHNNFLVKFRVLIMKKNIKISVPKSANHIGINYFIPFKVKMD